MEDEVWVCLKFLLLCSLLYILMEKMKIGIRSYSSKLPPGPPMLPIIGNIHQLGMLPHRSLHQLSKKYGPLFFLQLGNVPTIVVSSAEIAKQVMKTYDVECCSRPLLAATGRLTYNYLDLAFTPHGNYWKEMRKFCMLEIFSVKRIQSFQFIREEEVASMIDSIARSSRSGNLVNLSKEFMSLTTEITSRVAFGSSTFRDEKFSADKFHKLVLEALAIMGSFSAADYFPYYVGWIIDKITGYHKRLERIFHEFDFYYQRAIDDHMYSRMQNQEDGEYIIDALLKTMKNQTTFSALQITNDHIKAILMNLFAAGVDTVATVLGWVMAEMTKNPRVMKKAQEEIRNSVGKKGKVSESEIHQLQYLKLVIKEALRLHPPGALLVPRESKSQLLNINGYDVYPKTRILVNAWAIGRDPESWENPKQFYPERFMDSSIDFKGQHFKFIPFGAGRRICPGMHWGMLIVEVAVANLLYHFDWKLPNGMKEEDLNMEDAGGLTMHLKEDLLLVPTEYE